MRKKSLNTSRRGQIVIALDLLFFFSSGYMETGSAKKKYYMLSVFLGDVLGSPEFCSRIVRKIKRCEFKLHTAH